MRYLAISLMLFTLPLHALSQSNTEDVIYLKDGGVLRGEIIEYMGDEVVRIKTAGRNVFVVRMEDVLEITREKLPGRINYKSSGYINQTGIEVLPGDDNTQVRFQMVNGYQFTPRFSAGLGVAYIDYKDPLSLVPVYLDLRLKLLKANSTPFLFFKGGHGFSILPDDNPNILDHNGGFMMNTGIGLQFDFSAGFGMYLSGGYSTDKSGIRQEGWGGRMINEEISHRRVQFGIGFTF